MNIKYIFIGAILILTTAFASAGDSDKLSDSEIKALYNGTWVSTKNPDQFFQYFKNGVFFKYAKGEPPPEGKVTFKLLGRSIQHTNKARSWSVLVVSVNDKELQLSSGENAEIQRYTHEFRRPETEQGAAANP